VKQIKTGKVPGKLHSQIEIEGWSPDAFFDFNTSGESEHSPLWRYRKILEEDLRPRQNFYAKETELIRGQVTGDWISDLNGAVLKGTDWVNSHGLTFFPENAYEKARNEDVESVSVMHYLYRDFFNIHNRELMIAENYLTRTLEGKIHGEEKIYLDKDAENLGIKILTDNKKLKTAENILPIGDKLKFLVVGKHENINELKNNDVKISINPELNIAGQYILLGEEKQIEISIELKKGLAAEKITIAGITDLTKNEKIEGIKKFKVIIHADKKGIVPMVVIAEGNGWLAWNRLDIFVMPSAITSSDTRFNGVIVEMMRSILMRRIHNIIPEEEPRGEMRFPLLICGRFLGAENCDYFGFSELAYSIMEAYSGIIKRDKYLHQDCLINGVIQDWGGHFTFGREGNDGIGFFLFQAGKILIKNPNFKMDYDAISDAVEHLEKNAHWNGLLDSQSEIEDFFMSEHTSGNPYTQGLAIAGLLVLQKALKKSGYVSLSHRCRKLAKRFIDGFKMLYGKDGYFSNKVYSGWGSAGKWLDEPILNAYINLGSGSFIMDPSIQTDELKGLIEKTIEKVKEQCLVPGHSLVMGDPDSVHFGFSQCGFIANLLSLNRVAEAEPFMKEALEYWNTTVMTYILPEVVYVKNRDWWNTFDPVKEPKRIRELYPWVYKGDQPANGVFGLVRGNGNLSVFAYFLYVVDLITGIVHTDEAIQIMPKPFPGWNEFKAENINTRIGKISYSILRKNGKTEIKIHKPDGKAYFCFDVIGIENKKIKTDEKEIKIESLKPGTGYKYRFDLPYAETNMVLKIE
jgi:hypothetical protein